MGRKRRNAVAAGQTRLAVDGIEPNGNLTVPIGPLTLTRMVFDRLRMDEVLSGLKRDQGASVTAVTEALVTHAMQMRGLSINRMEDILENPHRREIYGLDDDVDKNDLYRIGRKLGSGISKVVAHIDTVLNQEIGVSFKTVFLDWSATYVDGKPTNLVRFGYSKDHRPDRPQVNIGMALDSVTGLLCGLTVVSGNTNDTKHFEASYSQVKPYLDPGCLIVFDAGAYSDDNGKAVKKDGFDFLTRVQLNDSDGKYLRIPEGRWLRIDDDIRAYMYRGNGRRCKAIFFSEKRRRELLESYRAKAERDYDEAINLKAMVAKQKPRKKYRNSNMFLKTSIGYVFSLDLESREEAIERAVKARITGREGYFVLMCSRTMLPSEMLRTYRSRNDIEDAYLDLKHGIDIRPVRCRDEDSVRGRILIAYLALTVLYFAKYVTPEIRKRTAETLVRDLVSFSLTVEVEDGRVTRRVYSNFNPTIRAVLASFERIPELIRRNMELRKEPQKGRGRLRRASENGNRPFGIEMFQRTRSTGIGR